MVGDSDKNSARSDNGRGPTRRTIYHDDRRPRTWSGSRPDEPAMDILIHTAERACVLVTLTFILAQTGSFTRPRRQIRPRGQVAAFLIFLVMSCTEEFIAQRHTPMNARIIAACAAGLLAGPVAGAAVGLGAALIAFALQPTPPPGFGLGMLA